MTQRDVRLKNRKKRLKHLPKDLVKAYNDKVKSIDEKFKEQGISNISIGKMLGVSSMAVANKLANESDFTAIEMMIIERELDVSCGCL